MITGLKGLNGLAITRGVSSAGPVCALACTISPDGSQPVGTELTAEQGTWTGGVTPYSYSYAWKTGATVLGTGTTYTTATGDVGNTIVLVETCTDADSNSASHQSSDSVEVQIPVPVNTVLPNVTISGIGTSAVATCDGGTWEYAGNNTFWWNGQNPENTGNTYAFVADDADNAVSCQVTNTNDSGPSEPATSNSWTLLPDPSLDGLNSYAPQNVTLVFGAVGSGNVTVLVNFYDQSAGNAPTPDSPVSTTVEAGVATTTQATSGDTYYGDMQLQGDGSTTISSNVISTLPTTVVCS